MSSFESELDAATSAIKFLSRIATILEELGIDTYPPQLYSDNEAMINFVRGQGVANERCTAHRAKNVVHKRAIQTR